MDDKQRKRREKDETLAAHMFFKSSGFPPVRFYNDPPKRRSTCRICHRHINIGMARLRLRVKLAATQQRSNGKGSWHFEDYFFHPECVALVGDVEKPWNPIACYGCHNTTKPHFRQLRVGPGNWEWLPLCIDCTKKGPYLQCDRCGLYNYPDYMTEYRLGLGGGLGGDDDRLCFRCDDQMARKTVPLTIRQLQLQQNEQRRVDRRIDRWIDRIRERGLWG